MDTVAPPGTCPEHSCDLLAVFAGNDMIATEMYRRSFHRLIRLARRRAPDLSSDLFEEIVNETWLLVYARGVSAFIAAVVEPDVYINQVLRNAVEVVRANNRPAGTPSRAPADVVRRLASEDYSEVGEAAEFAADHSSAGREIEIGIDIDLLVKKADQPVADALELILTRGLTVTEAASEVGLTRQTLGRRLQGLRLAA